MTKTSGTFYFWNIPGSLVLSYFTKQNVFASMEKALSM